MMNDSIRSNLEEEKLRLEIKELSRPLLLKPAFLGIIVSFAIALFGFLSGFFDEQLASLKKEKETLTKEMNNLIDEKTKLENEISEKLLELETAENQLDDYNNSFENIRISRTDFNISRALNLLRDKDPKLIAEIEEQNKKLPEDPLSFLELRRNQYQKMIDVITNKNPNK